MDRRQRKSRKAIFDAFTTLLRTKRYEQITVQDIIDTADISRSTFYAHFETKDMLLKAMSSDIFDHIFSGDVCEYHDHGPHLQAKLSHILWHLQEQKSQVVGILACESGELFMEFLRDHLHTLFTLYLHEFPQNVPQEFLLNHLVGSFSEAVRWWVRNGMLQTPEAVASYYIQCIR
jgi:AcrR family transcriptional regulator